MDQTFMKQRPVLPLVVSMALPMTLSMLVTSLYNIVDSDYFVAQISEDAMTALSLVYPVQNLVNAVTIGFASASMRSSPFSWGPASTGQPAAPPRWAFCSTPCTARC